MSDPTDDKTYVGLELNTFLRHFVPQVDKQNEELTAINATKFSPYADPTIPETMPAKQEPVFTNRHERRQFEKAAKKLEKKAAKKR